MKTCSSPIQPISRPVSSLSGFRGRTGGNPRRPGRPLAWMLLLALTMGSHLASAANGSWSNNSGAADASWGLGDNWNSGTIPGSDDRDTVNADIATFGESANAISPVLDSDRRLARIDIDNTLGDYHIRTASADHMLYLQGISTGLFITGGGATTIDPTVTLGASHTWSTGSTNVTLTRGLEVKAEATWTLVNTAPVNVGGVVRGVAGSAGRLIFGGSGSAVISASIENTSSGNNMNIGSAAGFSGTVTLTGDNSFTPGDFHWRSGTLEIGSDTALGTTASGGTVLAMSLGTSSTANAQAVNVLTIGAFTVTRDILFNSTTNTVDYTVGGAQTSGTSVYRGKINLNGHPGGLRVTSAAGGTVDFNGEIQGTLSAETKITKVGEGIVRFTRSAGNTYSGGTTVSAGTLLVENTSGSGLGTGSVAVNGGILGGGGSISGAVHVAAGAMIMGGDGTTASESLSLSGGLNLEEGAIIRLSLGAAGSHSSLAGTGSAAWVFAEDQLFSFVDLGAEAGFYDNLITGLIGDPGTTGSWRIANDGWQGVFSYDGSGGIDLTLSAVPEPSTWAFLLGGAGCALLFRRRMKGCRG